MTDIISPKALADLAQIAVDALLHRDVVVITHTAPYDRPRGWPLPIKRMPIGEPQGYRPLAILDYVEYALVEAERAQLVAEKATRDEQDRARTFGADYRADEPADNDWSDLV